jgi:NADPH:quinone reductase-like Zn-dependent oxidoreductase
MRALVMTAPGGADKSEIREVDPPRPAAGEVTIDVAYAGVNFMDVMARRGDAGYASSWPYRPGLEIAGTVREVGAEVTGPPSAIGSRPSRSAAEVLPRSPRRERNSPSRYRTLSR